MEERGDCDALDAIEVLIRGKKMIEKSPKVVKDLITCQYPAEPAQGIKEYSRIDVSYILKILKCFGDRAEDLDFALNCKIGEKECYFGQDSLLEIGRAMKIDSEYTRKLMVMPDARGDNFILPSRYETIAECHKKNPDITEYLVGLSNEEGRPRVVNENYFRMFFRRMVNHPENIDYETLV